MIPLHSADDGFQINDFKLLGLHVVSPFACRLGVRQSAITDRDPCHTPFKRQIAGSFAEYEKSRLVAKLKSARERKRLSSGKCEGRKSHAEINPEIVQIAKSLRRRKRGNSLRAVAAELAARGYVNVNGEEFSAASSLDAGVVRSCDSECGVLLLPIQ